MGVQTWEPLVALQDPRHQLGWGVPSPERGLGHHGEEGLSWDGDTEPGLGEGKLGLSWDEWGLENRTGGLGRGKSRLGVQWAVGSGFSAGGSEPGLREGNRDRGWGL